MRVSSSRVLIAMVACLLALAGCETSTKLGDLFQSKTGDPLAGASLSDPFATGSVGSGAGAATSSAGLLGSDPNDDLSLGKRHFRAENYGLAESHFRRAVELHPRDAEAWVGLAASYDRLRRFDLADRAYEQAISIIGPTAEILNNRGFSYMLRGNYARARETLLAAQAQDPKSPYIANNLELLKKSTRKGKGIQ